jgi:hypothetical protein
MNEITCVRSDALVPVTVPVLEPSHDPSTAVGMTERREKQAKRDFSLRGPTLSQDGKG